MPGQKQPALRQLRRVIASRCGPIAEAAQAIREYDMLADEMRSEIAELHALIAEVDRSIRELGMLAVQASQSAKAST